MLSQLDSPSGIASPQRPAVRTRGRVLVVDDMDIVREFVETFLDDAGFEVVTAHDGPAAIERMGESRVDVVFTDFNMPGMNGLKLLEHLKFKYPDVRCIVTSGFLDEDQHRDIEALGATILPKPYTISEAVQHIGRIASESRRPSCLK